MCPVFLVGPAVGQLFPVSLRLLPAVSSLLPEIPGSFRPELSLQDTHQGNISSSCSFHPLTSSLCFYELNTCPFITCTFECVYILINCMYKLFSHAGIIKENSKCAAKPYWCKCFAASLSLCCVVQSVQAVFKSLASLDRSVEKCRIQLKSEKSRVTITLHCKHGKKIIIVSRVKCWIYLSHTYI